jgi:hypothetical protein
MLYYIRQLLFKTNQGVESCTRNKAATGTSQDRVYADAPGIPDTDLTNTVEYYNECINKIKTIEHSATLFVFKMLFSMR